MFISYRVFGPNSKYKIDVNNSVMRELFNLFKKSKHIPINTPVSDDERAEFEKIVLRSDIMPDDDIKVAKQKYLSAVENKEKPRGYTSADIQALRDKILKGDKK